MASYTFRLPDIGEGVAEAEIVAWHMRVGDHADEDQPMVDMMTDKATVEMTAPVTGRVMALHGAPGDRVPVGSPLIEFDLDGDSAVTVETPAPPPAPETPAPFPLTSPVIRRRAREHGVDLNIVPGSGPKGRITPADFDAWLARGKTPAPPQRAGITDIKIIGLRRRIADRMQDTVRRIPHFSYVEEFDLTELEALRRDLNAAPRPNQPRLTLLPFFMRALVVLLPDFPKLNALYDDAAGILRQHDAVHIGIATQTENGLLVPVIRHAETLSIWDCARELARLTAAVRKGGAGEPLNGSTITLTSLGALGGIAATPVINAPEVAILAPNKLVERPVVVGGQVVVRTMMNLSGSFDHRIVDGHDAASFVQGLKRLIERPALLFITPP